MSSRRSVREELHKLIQIRDLSFRDFVEIALYAPEIGYYSNARSPAGKEGDFVTSPLISPVFSFAISRLIGEFMSRIDDGVCSVVDVGCGDGALIRSLAGAFDDECVRFAGVDRSLDRIRTHGDVFLTTDLCEVPRNDAQLLLCNELFDALPFARLVMRGDELHELYVTERGGRLEWSERAADPKYRAYFSERGIVLSAGQFADVSLDWESVYGELCDFVGRGLIVTFDYGLREQQLFTGRIRKFGTAAAYFGHRVSRDLLANPGEQDLTAHINFSDLERAGGRRGLSTLFFDRQAKFLLALGVTEHELFAPVEKRGFDSADEALKLREEREQARRLVLPDGIGEEVRVLVQAKGVREEGWPFQRKLF